jgi:hypothetical protein
MSLKLKKCTENIAQQDGKRFSDSSAVARMYAYLTRFSQIKQMQKLPGNMPKAY